MNIGLSGPGDLEVRAECDGCGKFSPISRLFPVGDGSIRVCGTCYAAATEIVLTQVACACPV